MPRIDDPGGPRALEQLAEFVESCGGSQAMVAAWHTELYDRSTGRSAGGTDRYFFDSEGKKYRSRAEVARALGLEGAPSIRVKGTAPCAPGEKPAVATFGEHKSFSKSARALSFEGDFSEFDAADVKRSPTMPRKWRPLLANVYVWPAIKDAFGSRDPRDWPRCSCTHDKGCGENCLNRQLLTECAIGFCTGGAPGQQCGDERRCRTAARRPCANTVIQRRQYPPAEIFDTASPRGFGLRCSVDVESGTVIAEYRGEVITMAELAERRRDRDPAAPFYYAALGDGLFVDAEKRGGYARFANHSCDPNCAMEKRTVGDEPRLVLVATRRIPKLTELCYNYNKGGTAADITSAQSCLCGAPNCAGAIGGKASSGAVRPRKRTRRTAEPPRKRGRPPRKDKPPVKKVRRRPNGASEEPLPDGPSSIAWARDTLRKLSGVDSQDAAYELASRLDPAALRTRDRSINGKADLNCFCQLPEFAAMPTSLLDVDKDGTLICCSLCDKWFHPTCVRLPFVPADGDDFA